MVDLQKQLNPDIAEFVYGKKELKKLTAYPLSVGDQFKVTDMVTKVLQSLVSIQQTSSLSDLAFASAIITALEDNLGKILSLVTSVSEEEAKGLLDDFTNTQLADLVDLVWTVNYEPALKKGQSLLQRAKSVFSLEKSSVNSSNSTLNTDSKTFTEKAIKMEE